MQWSNNPIEDIIRLIGEKQKEILGGLVFLGLIGGAFWGYHYYRDQYEEKAYKTLVEALEYYNAPIREEGEEVEFSFEDKKDFKTEADKWEKVVTVFKNAYHAYGRAGIAPLFLAYQAEGLIKQGKKPQACELLAQAINKMKNKDVADYYRVKHALLQIDSDDTEKGMATLKEIAGQEQSSAHDLALYRLGEYYWFAKDFKEARNYWNQLVVVARYSEDAQYPSPWAEKAKEKLVLIDAHVEQ